MQKGQVLHFPCKKCKKELHFSLFELSQGPIECTGCDSQYDFRDPTLLRQIEKFEKLCHQLLDSSEILSDTCVGIDFEGRSIKVPYKILLTRLGSKLDLKLNGKPLTIQFRLEPLEEMEKLLKSEIDCGTVNSEKPTTIPIQF